VAVTPEQAVDAANHAYGRHPGFRALHAKGTLLKGSFTATSEAATLTRAAHMQGDPVPVTVRVSNGAGNPNQPDYAPDVRGLAVKFDLPAGSQTDIVAQTAPRFPVASPEDFVELIRAQEPRSSAWRMPLFLARHPAAVAKLPPNFAALLPPTSYATCRYYAIHAFRFVDPSGARHHVRYTWLPEHDEPRLKPWAARRRGRDYLQTEISERIARGPVRFTLELQLADLGDAVDDPSSVWPAGRRRVRAGTLEITRLDHEAEAGGRVLVFDPVRVTDGIEPSGDPVLRFRPSAYSESVRRRERA
jgi:catalase